MATKRKGLGKGLSALIEDDMEEKIIEQNVNNIISLNLSDIEPNKNQPRKYFNEDALQELSDSIKQYGVIQPLIVIKKEKFYEIIAGERRWRAAKMAGLSEVPVVIKDYKMDEILAVSLIENIQRENLNAIEEAIAYRKLLTEYNLKQDEVAEKVSKSRSAITNTMRLLNLDERVQQMIIDDMITSGHARALLAINDAQLQYDLAVKLFDEKLSVRETEKLVQKLLKPKVEKPINPVDDLLPIYKELAKGIEETLGTKVMINRKSSKKGTIEIEYFTEEELERIIDLLRSIKIS